jgi:hypothetical protein
MATTSTSSSAAAAVVVVPQVSQLLGAVAACSSIELIHLLRLCVEQQPTFLHELLSDWLRACATSSRHASTVAIMSQQMETMRRWQKVCYRLFAAGCHSGVVLCRSVMIVGA